MKKYLPIFRFLSQAVFMGGLFLPYLPFADKVGQKIWISILFIGVFFCGWLCPFGALQEWLRFVAKLLHFPKIKIPFRYQYFFQLSRYFLYGLSMMNIVFYALNSRFYFEHNVSLGLWDGINGTIFLMFILLSLFMDRPYCNYFCVKGASLGVWGTLRLLGLRRDEAHCIHCHLCTQACPMNIPVEEMTIIRHPNCINCMNCLCHCPKDCIKFKLLTLKSKQE